MIIIQIVLVLFFLFAFIKVLIKFFHQELKASAAIGWLVFWIVSAIVVVVPDFASRLAKILGVGRGVDAIMYLAFVVLFFLVFKVFVRLEKMEKQLTKVVRQDALKKE
ncbi:MAG: hypothetical protein ACD_72C00515G0002 [uncultured bacterium]|nr:MAG: hypothetical protein ACD_72C00515G0002 [uncultured bacterium]